MSPPYLLTLSVLALLVVRINCQCTDQETSVASQEFKDCVDKKEYSLIHLDKAREDKKEFICAVFEQISDECSKALAKCRSREYVDDKVSLHINSISEILLTLNRDITLETCSVFITPSPPTIVQEGAGDAKPAYVTSTASKETVNCLLGLLALLALTLRMAT